MGERAYSMSGKTVLVTGSTDGIGRETAERLAALGAEVLVHGRDRRRGAAALAAVRAASPSGSGALYLADLSTVAGTRAFAGQVRRDHPVLDVLLANAGVYAAQRKLTPDGMELTFAVNVVAPIVLADALLPALRAAAAARVVIVSSASHWTGAMHWDDLQFSAPDAYDGLAAYDQSKLAIALLTFDLSRRLEGAGVSAVCLDPGDVDTRLLREGWPELPGISIADGAATSVYLASSPEADGLSGVYFEDGRETRPLEAALDRDAQLRIWAEVERLAGQKLV